MVSVLYTYLYDVIERTEWMTKNLDFLVEILTS